jgi:hypothetical protein
MLYFFLVAKRRKTSTLGERRRKTAENEQNQALSSAFSKNEIKGDMFPSRPRKTRGLVVPKLVKSTEITGKGAGSKNTLYAVTGQAVISKCLKRAS